MRPQVIVLSADPTTAVIAANQAFYTALSLADFALMQRLWLDSDDAVCLHPGWPAINGAQAGPFDMAALQANIRDGKISRSTLVWKPGMANWSAADTVPELQSLFAGLPPPLPRG